MTMRDNLEKLKLYYLHSHFDQFIAAQLTAKADPKAIVERLVELELEEKIRRSTERRIQAAKLGSFKLMNAFEWDHPTTINRSKIEELLRTKFIKSHHNIILVGPEGIGKTMIAKNIGWQALINGFSVLWVTASDLVLDLGSQESTAALQRRIKRYSQPDLLIIDELGYLSFDLASSDLLFKIVSLRYETRSIVLTTNLPFSDWGTVFPGASSLTALIGRLTHHSIISKIDGPSYRTKDKVQKSKQKAKKPTTEKETLQ